MRCLEADNAGEERAFEYDWNVVYFPSKAVASAGDVGEDKGVDDDKLLRYPDEEYNRVMDRDLQVDTAGAETECEDVGIRILESKIGR